MKYILYDIKVYFYSIKINFYSIKHINMISKCIFIQKIFLLYNFFIRPIKIFFLDEFFIRYFSSDHIWCSIFFLQKSEFYFQYPSRHEMSVLTK